MVSDFFEMLLSKYESKLEKTNPLRSLIVTPVLVGRPNSLEKKILNKIRKKKFKKIKILNTCPTIGLYGMNKKSLLIPHLIHLIVIAHNFCISHTYCWKFLNFKNISF